MPRLQNLLTTLRTNNMLNSATKEFFGSNIPHVVLVANVNEAVDQSINQFGNSAIVFGGGLAMDKLINGVFSLLNPKSFKAGNFANPVANQWFRLGKALAIYSMVTSYVVASPFLRNWVTYKRTGAENFTEVVGLKGDIQHQTTEQERRKKEQEYIGTFGRIWAKGGLVSAGILALTQLVTQKAKSFGKVAQFFQKHIGLPQGSYKHLKDLPAYLFWAIPAYLGLWVGARDNLEKKETLFKAAGFGIAFMALPRTLEAISNRYVKGKTFKRIGPGANLSFLIQLISGIIFYTSIPTVINLFKRRERAADMGLIGAESSENAAQAVLLSAMAKDPRMVDAEDPVQMLWQRYHSFKGS